MQFWTKGMNTKIFLKKKKKKEKKISERYEVCYMPRAIAVNASLA